MFAEIMNRRNSKFPFPIIMLLQGNHLENTWLIELDVFYHWVNMMGKLILSTERGKIAKLVKCL